MLVSRKTKYCSSMNHAHSRGVKIDTYCSCYLPCSQLSEEESCTYSHMLKIPYLLSRVVITVRTERNCERLHYSHHLILQDALWCFCSAVQQSHPD